MPIPGVKPQAGYADAAGWARAPRRDEHRNPQLSNSGHARTDVPGGRTV